MKRTIRRNCFETNSSSMHSIVVTKDDRVFTKESIGYPVEDGKPIRMWSESNLDFDRYPFTVLSEFEDKVRYIIASYCSDKSEKFGEAFVDKLTEIIREEIPDFKGIEVPRQSCPVYLDVDGQELDKDEVHWDGYRNDDKGNEEYVCVYTDAHGQKREASRAEYCKDYGYYGYVDHQSLGLLEGFLERENVTLKDFLFNKKYIIIIDGDEYCEFEKLKESGLVDMDNIDFEFPRPTEYGQISYDSLEHFERLSEIK